jgi:hypothetical protein
MRALLSARAGHLRSRCRLLVALLVCGAALSAPALTTDAWAAGQASWRFAPAQAPPPAAGIPPAPYPVPLGQVGAISFWAPNRGLLITGGTEESGGPVPAGLYAYDGVSWHQLSSVCGGAEGRIAWAGPEEFWTISDQRAGQLVNRQQDLAQLQSISLCHFLDGQVVGSYAMPLEQADSYLRMDAAACYGPSDCWFAGQEGSSPNFGAFHLHWDGSTVGVVYEPEGHAIDDMVNFAGQLYESVQIESGDTALPEESVSNPPVIHTISSTGVEPFGDLVTFSERAFKDLPAYGKGVLPDALQGFSLATDGPPLGAGATQLWAAADPDAVTPADSQPAAVTVLREAGGEWSQLTPGPHGESLLPEGTTLAGAERTQVGGANDEQGAAQTIAPEPGAPSAWLSLRGGTGAEVARLEALEPQRSGEPAARIVEVDSLPEADEQIGSHGEAGPIVCPAAHDCWMATAGEGSAQAGWLFHLTGEPEHPAQTEGYPQDTDPNFAGVISYRPPDSGVPTIYPDLPPLDDSLANQQQAPPTPSGNPQAGSTATRPAKKGKPLLEHVKSKLLHHRVLVITFTLTARAHVQLLAHLKHRLVASTRRLSLRAGSHQLSLSLNPAHWPTGLQFKATPIGASSVPQASGGAEGANSNDVVGT